MVSPVKGTLVLTRWVANGNPCPRADFTAVFRTGEEMEKLEVGSIG